MFVEPVGLFLGREDQGRNPLGHLVEHLALHPIEVHGAGQHDLPVGAVLALPDGHTPRRLDVPQFQRIQ